MDTDKIDLLTSKALEFYSSVNPIQISDNPVINREVIDSFESYPHLFVLCCLMDRQIDAGKAWRIPFEVCDYIGSRELKKLNALSEANYIGLFENRHLHRYNKKMALTFKHGLDMIETVYYGDASSIWKGCPHSAAVICRFLEFDGCGVKIATMATNLLHRALGVQFSNYSAIDISPDVHILRVMYRLSLIADRDKKELAIYSARGIYPSYPGLFDPFFWRIGKDYCNSSYPECGICPLKDVCSKRID